MRNIHCLSFLFSLNSFQGGAIQISFILSKKRIKRIIPHDIFFFFVISSFLQTADQPLDRKWPSSFARSCTFSENFFNKVFFQCFFNLKCLGVCFQIASKIEHSAFWVPQMAPLPTVIVVDSLHYLCCFFLACVFVISLPKSKPTHFTL